MSNDLLKPIPIEEADPLQRLMFSSMNTEETPCLQMEAYRELVQDLPPPTDGQMRAFAEYVSKAKSWYKHLSWNPPGHHFYFYLHPHAGCASVLLANGHTLIMERTSDTPSCHYSSMMTEVYREQFGNLAFSGPVSTGMFIPGEVEGEDAMLDCNPAMPVIQLSPDTARRPAQEILSAGECQLTGLLHPDMAESTYMQHQLLKHLGTVEPPDDDPTWAAIIEHCQTLATDSAAQKTSHLDEIVDTQLTELVARKRTEHLTAVIEVIKRMGAALLERRPSGHAASCNGKFWY